MQRSFSARTFHGHSNHKLTLFATLLGASLLRDAFAVRPTEDHSMGHYVTVLQTGTFSNTAGNTNGEGAEVVEDHVAERSQERSVENHTSESPQQPPQPPPIPEEFTRMQHNKDIDKLKLIIDDYNKGPADEDATERLLGAAPGHISETVRSDFSSAHTALGNSEDLEDMLKKLTDAGGKTILQKIEEEMKKLAKQEEAQTNRKDRQTAIVQKRQKLESENARWQSERNQTVTKANQAVKDMADVEKTKDRYNGVLRAEWTLQIHDQRRMKMHKDSSHTMYDYAERLFDHSEEESKNIYPDGLNYNGDTAIYGPKEEEWAKHTPSILAGHPHEEAKKLLEHP